MLLMAVAKKTLFLNHILMDLSSNFPPLISISFLLWLQDETSHPDIEQQTDAKHKDH